MKKQVILEQYEYKKLVQLAGLALQVVDKYIYEENKKLDKMGIYTHIMDHKSRDIIMGEIYVSLLYTDGSLKKDIKESVGELYFAGEIGKQSVLSEDGLDY
jgi:hypothetical protein